MNGIGLNLQVPFKTSFSIFVLIFSKTMTRVTHAYGLFPIQLGFFFSIFHTDQ